ncbi:TIGR02450 family Trp-rich protein [Massilia psychrophila]|uniref:TIGR02450 family Trp-rich protein n=1 Tax=Massilia psychrophila TaxID=1603353 RepID=UPI0027D964D2|nr:TIGR02450 family Trp-rich protein [Massilia psychrophila]
MEHESRQRTLLGLQPAKLLHSKWTATVPVDREKHFMVTSLIAPDVPGIQVDTVTMEAVLTGRSFILRWRELNDAGQWLQGWR